MTNSLNGLIAKGDMRIIFMGTPVFASVCLEALLYDGYNIVLAVTQPDKPVGRKKIITPPPTKVTASDAGIPVFQPDSMRDAASIDMIRGYNPDLIVTAAYGKILPQEMLDIPRFGCINVHGSLLPKLRGASPVQQAILNGDSVTGVTIMKMDAGMDTGDMISSCEVAIDENIDTDGLMLQLAHEGAKLMLNTIPGYVTGAIKPIKQDDSEATSCSVIRAEDGRFCWSEDARTIHNMVRALRTWPGAQTTLNGKKLKIYETRVAADFAESADSVMSDCEPGTIVKAHKGDLIVKCGSGYLALLELALEGGKRLKAADCAHNYKTGTKLGT